jgi:hypothetical protein
MMRLTCKVAGFVLLALGVAMVSPAPVSVPEIDPSAGINAVALVSGVLLILHSRKRLDQ